MDSFVLAQLPEFTTHLFVVPTTNWYFYFLITIDGKFYVLIPCLIPPLEVAFMYSAREGRAGSFI